VCGVVHTVSRVQEVDSGGSLWCKGGYRCPPSPVQLLLAVSPWYYQLRLLLNTHNSQRGSRKSRGGGGRSVLPGEDRGVARRRSRHNQRKRSTEKVHSYVCVFFCLFLHFIIKNKSVFVLYNTIQHPHRGSINHQSSTDKERKLFFSCFSCFLCKFFFTG